MNFTSLRAIIKNIKMHVRCPQCDNTYSNDDVSVISSVADRSIIVAQCNSCSTPILITATVKIQSPNSTSTLPEIVTEHRKLSDVTEADIISTDDVVNIHKFLKNFKGDLSKILELPEDKA